MSPALLTDKEKGKKLINVYWDGIKFTIKFVDADAIIIKIKAKTTSNKLSNFPRILLDLLKFCLNFLDLASKKHPCQKQ